MHNTHTPTAGRHSKKRLAVAVAATALGMLSLEASADAVDERIAELERQLAELKALVARNSEASEETLQTLAVHSEELETVRPVRNKGTTFRYGGYVQMDGIASYYTEGRPDALMEDLFVPSLVPVEPLEGTGDSFGSTNFHAKTSRFFFDTRTPTNVGDIQSHIELDFILSGQGDERVTNSFSSRIRSAYISWEYKPGHSLLAGQEWSTFFNTAALPDLIDFVGPVGTVVERQPQIRWTAGPWKMAIENHFSRIDLPGGGTQMDDGSFTPDLVLRYDGSSGNLDWSVAAIGRLLSFEQRSDPNTKLAHEETLGYGVSLSGKWNLGRDDLRFMVNFGDVLGRYLGLNSFNDGYIDRQGRIRTNEQWGGVLAYRHYWSDQWRSNFSISASGADNPNSLEFAASDFLAKSYQSMHANLSYLPAPRLSIGGELMYGYKELQDGRDGELYRMQLGARYTF
jgi:hypothetical protein